MPHGGRNIVRLRERVMRCDLISTLFICHITRDIAIKFELNYRFMLIAPFVSVTEVI